MYFWKAKVGRMLWSSSYTTTASKRNRHVSEAYCRTVLHTKTYNDAGMYWAFYIVLETSHKSKIQNKILFSYVYFKKSK